MLLRHRHARGSLPRRHPECAASPRRDHAWLYKAVKRVLKRKDRESLMSEKQECRVEEAGILENPA
jgi:hypothetical protein